MTPAQAQAAPPIVLTPQQNAIARSVLYAALFDYPLTLAQLRQSLIGSRQTASEIMTTVRDSPALQHVIEHRDGFFFPAGASHLVEIRRFREARSRAFLSEHGPLLRLVSACPFVRLVALSGSIAHLNLENGGDLDLFIVTRGARVWSTAVLIVLLAKLLGRRRTLCANYIVADTALAFDQQDMFTASQIIGLKPLTGDDVLQQLLDANPFVKQHYPNFHPSAARSRRRRRHPLLLWLKPAVERALLIPSLLAEWTCRAAYRSYLRRRSSTWTSPEQVVLGDRLLKLHTRSHRTEVLSRFGDAVRTVLH